MSVHPSSDSYNLNNSSPEKALETLKKWHSRFIKVLSSKGNIHEIPVKNIHVTLYKGAIEIHEDTLGRKILTWLTPGKKQLSNQEATEKIASIVTLAKKNAPAAQEVKYWEKYCSAPSSTMPSPVAPTTPTMPNKLELFNSWPDDFQKSFLTLCTLCMNGFDPKSLKKNYSDLTEAEIQSSLKKDIAIAPENLQALLETIHDKEFIELFRTTVIKETRALTEGVHKERYNTTNTEILSQRSYAKNQGVKIVHLLLQIQGNNPLSSATTPEDKQQKFSSICTSIFSILSELKNHPPEIL